MRPLVSRVSDASEMRVVCIEDADPLADLRAGWDRLSADIDGPNSQLDHVIAASRSLPRGTSPFVVTVWHLDSLVGVAPLVRVAGRPARLRAMDGLEAGGFRYAGDEALARLLRAVVMVGLPVELPALPAGSPTDRLLAGGDRTRAFVHATTWWGGPSIPLDGSWTDPTRHLSSNRRSALGRALRKAQRDHEVQVEYLAPGSAVEEHFAAFVALERLGWKGAARSALAHDDPQRETLRAYLTAPAVRPDVRIARMLLDGEVIAIDLDVVVADRLWWLKGAYDERLHRYTPGLQLKRVAIAAAAEAGLRSFEMMGETAAFKEMWGCGPQELHRVRVYPLSVLGVQALLFDVAGKVGQRAVGWARGVLETRRVGAG